MKLVLKLCSLGLLVALAVPAGVVQGADKAVELKLGQVSSKAGPGIQVPITLRSLSLAAQEIQGLVVVFEWDATAPLTGTNIINAPALTNPALLLPDPTPGPDATPGADTIVKRIGEQAGKRFMVLGVVMDSNGDDREIIPITNTADVLVATAEFTSSGVTADTPVDLRVSAADSKYSADLGGAGPVQDNLVQIGSQPLATWLNTVGDNQGALSTVDGRVTLLPGSPPFQRGDANADGSFDLTDAIFTFGCQFLGSRCPDCEAAADTNDDGQVDIADGIYSINFKFRGGPAPDQPFPGCGVDPTPDALPCDSFPPCR